jgi:hypothetical protein
MTIRSPGSSSDRTVRATCRSRLATRWRSTDPPTDLVTTNPICATSSGKTPPRRACTTRSGWATRTPFLTARLKSVDRLIRFPAGSTARDLVVRQSENRGLCGGGRRRWPGLHGCACAAENREPWPDADCSAGRSACPWPRLYLLVMCGASEPVGHANCTPPGSKAPFVQAQLVPARSRRPVAAVPPLTGRPLEGTEVASAGQTTVTGPRPWRSDRRKFTGWHPAGNLLVSRTADRPDLSNYWIVYRRTTIANMLRRREPASLCTPVDNHVDSYGPGFCGIAPSL